jgi:hypothetical protein
MNAPATTTAATTALGPVARAGGREPRKLKISFEFSPPATPEAEESLWKAIRRLEPLKPEFISVTYGAGGSTRDRTHRTVTRVLGETGMTAAAHLTCVNASRAEVDEVIQAYWDSGMRHIVALRGDPPGQIGGVYEPRADGYANATELTAGIKAIAPFEVSVGVHPQIHRESGSLQREIDVATSSSTSTASCASSRRCGRRASASRSCRGSCRFRTSPAWCGCASRCGSRCRTGWPITSKASTTIRPPAASSPPQSPPKCAHGCERKASRSSISTP